MFDGGDGGNGIKAGVVALQIGLGMDSDSFASRSTTAIEDIATAFCLWTPFPVEDAVVVMSFRGAARPHIGFITVEPCIFRSTGAFTRDSWDNVGCVIPLGLPSFPGALAAGPELVSSDLVNTMVEVVAVFLVPFSTFFTLS